MGLPEVGAGTGVGGIGVIMLARFASGLTGTQAASSPITRMNCKKGKEKLNPLILDFDGCLALIFIRDVLRGNKNLLVWLAIDHGSQLAVKVGSDDSIAFDEFAVVGCIACHSRPAA